MITILLIWAGLYLVYKAGGIRSLLKFFHFGGIPAPPPEIIQEPPETREKWEAEVRYILSKQGLIDPDTVKYMGDEMLKNIVREYLDI